MQAKYLHGSVTLSTEYKGKPRKHPVWVLRYRLPSGKDSHKTLGKAWLKASRPQTGFMTKAQAEATAQRFLDDHADSVPEDRKTLGRALTDFLAFCEHERGLRASTLHDYRRIGERLSERRWRSLTWRDRPLDTFTEEDIITVRSELVTARRNANTLNHYRRVIRGVFGTGAHSPALAWDWTAAKPESEGQLRFYDPAQVAALKQAAAHCPMDVAIYTLAAEAGPRLSEIRGLKVRNVDFENGVVRFEDGFTTRGGHAGNKGRRVRSVPMSDNARSTLWPLCKGRSGDALVFDAEDGGPICGSNLYRRFRNAAKRAGLPILRFHDLRHSFGTQAIRAFNIYEVQRMMGHRHITTTERYLHYAPNPDAAAKLSGLWEAPENVASIRRVA